MPRRQPAISPDTFVSTALQAIHFMRFYNFPTTRSSVVYLLMQLRCTHTQTHIPEGIRTKWKWGLECFRLFNAHSSNNNNDVVEFSSEKRNEFSFWDWTLACARKVCSMAKHYGRWKHTHTHSHICKWRRRKKKRERQKAITKYTNILHRYTIKKAAHTPNRIACHFSSPMFLSSRSPRFVAVDPTLCSSPCNACTYAESITFYETHRKKMFLYKFIDNRCGIWFSCHCWISVQGFHCVWWLAVKPYWINKFLCVPFNILKFDFFLILPNFVYQHTHTYIKLKRKFNCK